MIVICGVDAGELLFMNDLAETHSIKRYHVKIEDLMRDHMLSNIDLELRKQDLELRKEMLNYKQELRQIKAGVDPKIG